MQPGVDTGERGRGAKLTKVRIKRRSSRTKTWFKTFPLIYKPKFVHFINSFIIIDFDHRLITIFSPNIQCVVWLNIRKPVTLNDVYVYYTHHAYVYSTPMVICSRYYHVFSPINTIMVYSNVQIMTNNCEGKTGFPPYFLHRYLNYFAKVWLANIYNVNHTQSGCGHKSGWHASQNTWQFIAISLLHARRGCRAGNNECISPQFL